MADPETLTNIVMLATTFPVTYGLMMLVPRLVEGVRRANAANYHNMNIFMRNKIGGFNEMNIGRPFYCAENGFVIPVNCDGEQYFIKSSVAHSTLMPSMICDATVYSPREVLNMKGSEIL